MKVSVIVAVKNAANGFARTLDSIRSQFTGAEVIVIDGGSTDGTVEIANERISEIGYFETGLDTGIANAFNRGLDRATGEVIAVLNAGDRWFPDTLRAVETEFLASPGPVIVHSAISFTDARGRTYRIEPNLTKMHRRMYVFHPTLFVDRRVYASVGPYDESYAYAMDSEWVHRALTAGCRFRQVDTLLADMALGGRSDQHYWRALSEYRRSLVHHGLGTPIGSLYWLAAIGAAKTAMRLPWVGSLRARGRTGISSANDDPARRRDDSAKGASR